MGDESPQYADQIIDDAVEDELIRQIGRDRLVDKAANHQLQSSDWTDGRTAPLPLIRDKLPASPYPMATLGPLEDAARAIQDMTQAPEALAAQSVLGVASLAFQGFADVQLHHDDKARAPLSLFLLTVCESGERKSACDKLAMQPVRAFEERLQGERQQDVLGFQNEHAVYAERRKQILKQLKTPQAAIEARRLLDELGPEPEPPLGASIVASDPTIEGIVKNLHGLRASLGLFSDEAGAFIGGHAMNKDNALKTAAKLSKFWDGTAIDRWRAEDGNSLYLGRRLSCHLMAQDIAAQGFLADPVMNGQGLLARFLIVQPTSKIGYRLKDEQEASSAPAHYRFHLKIMDALLADLPLAKDTKNQLEPRLLELSPDARTCLRDFARQVETDQRPEGVLEDYRAFASKSAEHAARLAGVLTLYENLSATQISEEMMRNAVELMQHYLKEAQRLTGGVGVAQEIVDAEKLRVWLIEKWPHEHISASDAIQKGPLKRGYSTKTIRHLLEVLAAHDWLVKQPQGALIDGAKRKEAWRVRRRKSK